MKAGTNTPTRTDAERLDWLEARGNTDIECDVMGGFYIDPGLIFPTSRHTLREAIDAAMDAEPQNRAPGSAG